MMHYKIGAVEVERLTSTFLVVAAYPAKAAEICDLSSGSQIREEDV